MGFTKHDFKELFTTMGGVALVGGGIICIIGITLLDTVVAPFRWMYGNNDE